MSTVTATASYSGTAAVTRPSKTATATYAGTVASATLSSSGSGTADFTTVVVTRPSKTATATYSGTVASATLSSSGSGTAGFSVFGRTNKTATATYTGTVGAARTTVTATAKYGGLTDTRTSVTASANYAGTSSNTINVPEIAESGQFILATATGSGNWLVTFPPEITPPLRYLVTNGLNATIYAPPSSVGYAMIVSFGLVNDVINVQPTSYDDKRGKPIVIYAKSELPFPFNPFA